MNKKGMWFMGPLVTALTNPWILLSLLLVIVAIAVMFFFAFGKIIGAALILGALWGWMKFKLHPWAVVAVITLGVFMFWNPMHSATLAVVPFG